MHRSLGRPRWRHVLPVLALLLLVGHGAVLYQVSSRSAGIVMSGALALLVLKHLGVLGSLYAVIRGRRRPDAADKT
jgi:hypothetical protein